MANPQETWFRLRLNGDSAQGPLTIDEIVRMDGDRALSRGGAFARDQLYRTKKAIITTSGGYVPCVFRPPYGATSGGLVSVGTGLGMKSILWDVDTNDWKLPGTSAIISRAVGGARAGSIILMHDGGGPRGGTAAAVPAIIRGLRAKGYGFATVPELLGLKTRWRLSRS